VMKIRTLQLTGKRETKAEPEFASDFA
jgi:hypothetical protein